MDADSLFLNDLFGDGLDNDTTLSTSNIGVGLSSGMRSEFDIPQVPDDENGSHSHIDMVSTQNQHSSNVRMPVKTGSSQKHVVDSSLSVQDMSASMHQGSRTSVDVAAHQQATAQQYAMAQQHAMSQKQQQQQQMLMQQQQMQMQGQGQGQPLNKMQKTQQHQHSSAAARSMQQAGMSPSSYPAVSHQHMQHQHHQQQPHQQYPAQQQQQQQYSIQHANLAQQQDYSQSSMVPQQQYVQQQQQPVHAQQQGSMPQQHVHAQKQAAIIQARQQQQQMQLQQQQLQQQQQMQMQQQRMQGHVGDASLGMAPPGVSKGQRMQSPISSSPVSTSSSNNLVQHAQSTQNVIQRLQLCQSQVVEAIQRCAALVAHISRLSTDVAEQLQQHVPDVALEAAHQSVVAAHAELCSYARLVSASFERMTGSGSPSIGYGGAQGQMAGNPGRGQSVPGQHRRQGQLPPSSNVSMSGASPRPGMSPLNPSSHGHISPHPEAMHSQSAKQGGILGNPGSSPSPVVGQGVNVMHQHKQGPQGMQQQMMGGPGMMAVQQGVMQNGHLKSEYGDMHMQKSMVGSADALHSRPYCTLRQFKVGKERTGVEGGQGNEAYCDNCYCFVCDTKASECQGWLCVGHCHANENDPFWNALREFTQNDMLCNSPLLQALGSDEQVQMEAHKSCVNGLLAFHCYRRGDLVAGDVYEHSFQHVTDAASATMKAIIGHLSDPKGPRTTLAVLDGITSAVVINTWRPGPNQDSANHRWCKDTFSAYKAIIEQLEKYWVLTIVRTSTRCVPPPALAVLAQRLKELSKYAQKELAGRNIPLNHIPLTHAISACERGWRHPVVVAILEGQCTDLSQREAKTLQGARLHLLEHAERWKEAYHYAIFHGRVAKSLAYMVRAGRHADVLPMVLRQGALASELKCLSVCAELVAVNQPDAAVRLAMFCSFRELEGDVDDEAVIASRMPFVHWLIEHVISQVDPAHLKARNTFGSVPVAVEHVRRDAEEWALQMMLDLPTNLLQPLPEALLGSTYSSGEFAIERIAALCAVALPRLALSCAQRLTAHGDHCAAISVVILAAMRSIRSDASLVTWALQEILPKLGMAALSSPLQKWKSVSIPCSERMKVASALLSAGESDEALSWALCANLEGAPAQDRLPFANFEETREFRNCDLSGFIKAAQTAGNMTSALLLAELQMWWDPTWAHLQALSPLCSAQKFGLRRQQLQSLALNDKACRPEVRFEVLVREGMHDQAVALMQNLQRENAQACSHALVAAFQILDAEIITQPSLVEAILPLLENTAAESEDVDPAMEVVAASSPEHVLQFYDRHVDTWQEHCQQNAVNMSSKNTLRTWLFRARRMYYAAGQQSQWERRFSELSSALRRKTSLSSVFADLSGPAQPTETSSTIQTAPFGVRESGKGSRSAVASPRPPSMPSTPSMQ